ncbi:ATP-binding cassette subfamily B protein [Paenibacillus cellulosilyticus]|uniref:ATP-binding cassette subfamily B protein n=1 Tax=Paenibacillus cellulosilyticus TaxID=375489 RepID=A0A2V2YVJ1_9BACL|nr:ABC transporter ATP-binding protein [Paenibacillus cellulosilyticus]PWW05242.1 ATP-binding cassette subfamily B protein [Paenibacillus cellulosilyticus]QKS43566.1 ABC transporter ATP-binding protein [Paenibacillus cellulosilyticus]
MQKASLDTVTMLMLPLRLYLIKLVMDRIQQWGQPTSDRESLFLACAGLALLMTAAAFIGSSSLLKHTRIYEIGTLLKERLIVEKTASLPLRAVETPSVQDVRRRALLYAPDAVCLEGMSLLIQSMQAILLTGLICWMGYWPLAVGLLLLGCGQSWLYAAIGSRLERTQTKQATSLRLADHLHQLLIAEVPAKEIRIFGLHSLLQQRWLDYSRDAGKQNEQAVARSERQKLLPELSFSLISGIAILLIILSSSTNISTAGDYVVLFQCVTLLAGAIPSVVKQVGSLSQMAVHCENFKAYIQHPDDRTTYNHNQQQRGNIPEQASGPIGLRTEQLTFRYNVSPTDRLAALDDISFEMERGTKIAIVGENGSGKSTLVKLLLGLYRPDAGEVHWLTKEGNVQAGHPTYRTAAVFQDFNRYQMRLRDNVAIGDVMKVTDDAAITEALAKAGLREWHTSLDDTIGTAFGRFDLSGGQWQKVAAARAYMRGDCFLVFDEPTSALDPQAEREAFADFLRAAEGQTAILVTHRLGAAKLADTILVLKDGRLVEQGTHAQLMTAHGEYERLYRLQAAWYV